MSGLTRRGMEILDLHDSGVSADAIAAVLRLPVASIRPVLASYRGTAERADVLDDLLPYQHGYADAVRIDYP